MFGKVKLKNDNKEIVNKEIKSIYSKLSFLNELVNNDKLTDNMIEVLCGRIEMSLADLSTAIGYDGDTSKKVEERFKESKELRNIISDLEKKLESKDIVDKIPSQLSNLTDTLKEWWKLEGFNYVHNITYSSYGIVDVDFGFNFENFATIYSSNPSLEKEKHEKWIKSLEDKGYLLLKNENGKVMGLLDCDTNRNLLLDILNKRFPTFVLNKIETNLNYTLRNKLEFKSISISIKDLSEIKKLENIINK